MLPFVILPLHATLRSIDPAVLQAASLHGAGRRQAFRRVPLPLALPGVAAGGLMVFVMSLGYFVTPALLDGTANMMLAELIAQLVQSLTNWGLGGGRGVRLPRRGVPVHGPASAGQDAVLMLRPERLAGPRRR